MVKHTYIGLIFALAGLSLSGCSTPFTPGASFTSLSKPGVIHSNPSLNQSISKKKNSDSAICLGRGADTAFETDDTSNLSISLVNFGKTGKDAGDLNAFAGEEEMSGRTPSVLITRELMYRACELATNFNLTKQEATAVYLKTLDVVSQGWQKETERTTITFSDTLSNRNVNSVTESSTTAGSAAALPNGSAAAAVGAPATVDQSALPGGDQAAPSAGQDQGVPDAAQGQGVPDAAQGQGVPDGGQDPNQAGGVPAAGYPPQPGQ